MRVELMFPSLYLKAADLRGKDFTLTIDLVQIETLRIAGGREEVKPVVYFAELAKRAKPIPKEKIDKKSKGRQTDEKRVVLNKTNAKTIAGIYGNETDSWIGKKITLYPTTTKFGRETHDCIRVRESVPQ